MGRPEINIGGVFGRERGIEVVQPTVIAVEGGERIKIGEQLILQDGTVGTLTEVHIGKAFINDASGNKIEVNSLDYHQLKPFAPTDSTLM